MTGFFQSLRFFTNGISYVNDLNKALTEISIVTGKSQEDVAKLGLEYNKLAQQMGVNTKEIAQASVEFYRQGLSQAEVMEKMKIATEYAKISSLEFTESAEILTATVNSMGISIENASDVFAYLGDATATGADEIGRAFQKVGGTAGALNIEFEKVASWIAVVSSRTRESAETIGQSIKSVLARVQQLRQNGFTEEDGTQVNQVAKSLAQAGIALMDTQGQFRDFGTVMDELGAKWGTLDQRTKSYIATTVAGTYQQSRFLNLMEGYGESVDLYQQSLQAAGTTQQKYNLFLQSTEAHLNKLVAAGQGVWQHTFDSETIRAFIDVLTKLVTISDNVIQEFGLLPPVIAIVSSAFFLLNNNALKKVNAELLLIPLRLKLLNLTLKETSVAATIATGAMTALRAAMSLILPVALITIGSIAIQKLIEHFSNLKSKAEEARESLGESFNNYDSINNEISQIKNLYSEYEALTSKINLTSAEKQQLFTIRQKLAEQFPSIVTGYDKEGNAILDNIDNIKEEIAQKERLLEINQKSLQLEFKQNGKETEKNVRDKTNQLSVLNKEYDRLTKYYDEINSMSGTTIDQQIVLESGRTVNRSLDREKELKNTVDAISNVKNKINELQPEVQQVSNEFKRQAQTVLELDSDFKKLGSTINSQLINSAKELKSIDLTDFISKIQDTDITNYLSDVQTAINEFNNKQINFDQFTNKYTEAFGKIQELIQNTFKVNPTEANAFTQSLLSQISPLGDIQKKIIDTNNALKEMKRIQNEASEDLNAYNQIINEYSNAQGIAQERLIAFKDEHPRLAGAIELINGKYQLNIEKLKDLILAQQLAASGAVQGQNIMNSVISAGTLARIAMYGLEIEKLTTLAEAQAMANTIVSKEFSGGSSDAGIRNKILERTTSDLNKVVELRKLAEEMKKPVSMPKVNLGGGSKSSGSGGGSSSQFNKTLDLSKQKLEENTQLVEKLKDELDDALTYDQRATIFDKINEAYTQRLSILQQIKKMENDQLYIVTQQIQKSKVLTAEQKKQVLNGDFTNLNLKGDKYKAIAETIDQYQSLKSAMASTVAEMNGIDDSIRENNLGKFNDNLSQIDNRISSLNNSISIVESELQLLTEGTSDYNNKFKEQIELNKQLESALQNKKSLYEAELSLTQRGTIRYYELAQALQEVNKLLVDQQIKIKQQLNSIADDVINIYKEIYQKQKDVALDAIDDELDALEKSHSKKIDMYDEELSAIEDIINAKLRLISDQEDERDYNKELEKLQKERQDILNKINVLSMDDSFESRARITELNKQLTEKDNEIEEYKHNRTIDLRKQNLQDQLDTYKEDIDKKKDSEDEKFNAEKERLERIRRETERHYDNLINDERKFSQLRESILNGNLNNIQSSLDTFASFIQNNMSIIGESIVQNLLDKIAEAKQALEDVNNYFDSGFNNNTNGNISDDNTNKPEKPSSNVPSGWLGPTASGGYHKDIQGFDWGIDNNGNIYKDGRYIPSENYKYIPSEVIDIARRRKAKEFKVGGVGDYTGLAMLHGTKQKSEVIFNAEQAKKLYNLVANLPNNFLNYNFSVTDRFNAFMPNVQKLINSITPQSSNVGGGNLTVNVNIDNLNGTKKDADKLADVVFQKIISGRQKLGGII